MSNDNDVVNLFKENNDKILFSQLMQDIANNDDSLKITLFNHIELNCLKLQQRLNNCLKENNVNYDVKELVDFIDRVKRETQKCIVAELADRKENYEKEVQKGNLEFIKTDEKIKNDISEKLNVSLNKVIYIDSMKEFNSKFDISDEDVNDVIIKCFQKYDFELSKFICDSFIQRDNSLKNTIIGTRDRIDKLNADTVGKLSLKVKKSN